MHNEETINKILAYMETNNLNQTQLGNRLGVSTSQVNRWLRKKNISSAWVQLLIAKGIIKE